MRDVLRKAARISGLSALATAGVTLAILACGTRPSLPPGPTPSDYSEAQAAWGRVLETRVDDRGRVDFAELSKAPGDLEAFLRWVAVADERRMETLERLAFRINAYNALAMYGILRAGIPENLDSLAAKVRFFVLPRYEVAGRRLSLYRFENAVIRPEADARIHAALNCMSGSCPRLPRDPFTAEALDEQLEREARLFYDDPRNVSVDHERKTIQLSKILRFYTRDFLSETSSLTAYVNRHRQETLPEDYRLEFIPYDWTVSQQR